MRNPGLAFLCLVACIAVSTANPLPKDDDNKALTQDWSICVGGVQTKNRDCTQKVKTGKDYGPCVDGIQTKQRPCKLDKETEEAEDASISIEKQIDKENAEKAKLERSC